MTSDNEALTKAQVVGRRRIQRDAPKPLLAAGPSEAPVFTCRDCREPLPWDDQMARKMAIWFDPGTPRFRCAACDAIWREADRAARMQVALAAREAELQRIREDLPGALSRCGVPPAWQQASLNDCPDLPAALVESARQWALDPQGIVYVSGPVGSGKSWLAVAMLAEAMAVGGVPAARCRYVGERGYLDGIKAAFDRDAETPAYVLANDPRKAVLLVFDDAGSGYLTDWGRGEVAGLIEQRHADELATIVTSNLALDQLAGTIDARTASRISEFGHLWELAGKDLRRHGTLRK